MLYVAVTQLNHKDTGILTARIILIKLTICFIYKLKLTEWKLNIFILILPFLNKKLLIYE